MGNANSGRTSTYDPAIGEKIYFALAEGMPLTEILRQPGMPLYRTVINWADDTSAAPGFSEKYARGRQHQVLVLADQILEIADDSRNDYMDRMLANGEIERVLDPESVRRSQVRIDTRKWLLSKLKPAVYGDRVGVDVTGQININVVNERLAALQAGRLRARTIEVVAEQAAIAGPQQETSTAASASLAETLCADDSNA